MTTSTTATTTKSRSGSSVRLSSVSKSFGATSAVSAVNLDIEAGEFVTLLGPSGSGKTTILRMLAGFELPTSGSIFLGGNEVGRIPPAQRNIGMVFQHYALFPHMDVRENIDYGLRMRRWSKASRQARIDEMLHLVGLESFGARRPNQLSGGQQQRVALARALAIRPQLLLMDEPLGALDRALRVEMSGEIKRLHRETGTTFLYVTHDQEEALLLSDRVAIMRDGRIGAIDTPEALHDHPPTRFVAEFFANANVLHDATVTTEQNAAVVR
ncbi:MAG TPA: ABC transporter ATP-binding protein, partial [Terrimesophilobacter sp.]|nr:ABC transporter ATP-binding protein [Terrimesophilobacter sp.]